LQEKTPLLNRLTKAYHLDDQIRFPPDYCDKMLDVEAAVGAEQLKKYPEIIQHRRKLAHWYDKNLERRDGWVFPPIQNGATYSHYVVRVPDRKSVIAEFASQGLHLGELIQYSIPNLGVYKGLNQDCFNASIASKATINFPLQVYDLEDQSDR